MGSKNDAAVTLDTDLVSDTITRPSNTTAYAAGDVISEVTTNDYFTFSDMVKKGRGTGSIDTARIISSANAPSTPPDLELWLFSADISEVADNSAFNPSNAELLTLVGVIDFPTGDFKSAGSNTVCEKHNVGLVYRASNDPNGLDQSLIGQLVVRNAYTPESAETFTVQLGITRD